MEFVRLTKEDTYGVYDITAPIATQDIFLPQGNAMTVRLKPTFWTVTDASQGNRLVRSNVARKPVNGTLQSYLFPGQAPFLMDLAAGLVGTAPCFDLPSFTIDHVVYAAGCAPIYRRYLGCKIGGFTLSADQSDQGCLVSFSADIVGSTVAAITSTDFGTQPLTAYPADDPYLFFQSAGFLTIGSVRTNYQSLSVSIANTTKSFMDENQFNQRVQWFGRRCTFAAKLLYKSNADRVLYEAGTKQAVSVKFGNGVNTLLVDFQAKNNIDSLADDIPLDDFPTQSISMTALVDPATGTDLSFTTT